MTDKTDIVIPWVDGADPAWGEEFSRWKELCTPACGTPEASAGAADTGVERYRDWDLMRYWFRGVEKFAPWAGRIHFVTWGHLPSWLDASNPNLNIVRHTDFIPSEYLPTFSSCAIELNIHRIEGLSERFIYFNDDTFLTRPTGEERFFRRGLPVSMARLAVIRGEPTEHNMLECVEVINSRYRKSKSIGSNPGKWFSFRYRPADMFKTLTLMPWSFFPGFREHHMPQPFFRETFRTLWREEAGRLDATCRHRFRTPTDLSQWVMHFEQLASGRFAPHGYRDTLLTRLTDGNACQIADALRGGRYSMICVNDNGAIADFEEVRRTLRSAFEEILPEKSSYEL